MPAASTMTADPVPGLPGLFRCRLDPGAVPLSEARIVRALGYAGSAPDYVAEAVDTVCAELRRQSRPAGGFRLFPAECGPEGFRCAGQDFRTGPEIAGRLGKAERLALFVATVGEGYEELRRAFLEQDDPMLAFVMDAAGSEWAERTADLVERTVRRLAEAEGMAISNRYSPGYCGWAVAEQHRLFALLPKDFCGISLNGSAMMRPMKSVSGVIGLGREVAYSAYRCDLCNLFETCQVRRNMI